MQISIRQAISKDVDELVCVLAASVKSLCAKDYTSKQLEIIVDNYSSPDSYRDLIESKRSAIFVAEDGSAIVGFASLWGRAIGDLFVHPLCVRRGVGTCLVDRVEQEAMTRKLRQIKVMSSLTAKPFYLARGYRIIKPSFLTDSITNIQIACIDMAKSLR